VFLQADFHAQRFDRHFHEEFVIGTIESGCQAFAYDQGRRLDMSSGSVALIAPGLADLPVGLAVWVLDHDRHSYEQIPVLFVDGQPFGDITRDDITLYWLTNTETFTKRLHWENARIPYKGEVSVPAAFTAFPGEAWRAPRSWVERTDRNLIYFHEVDKGDHFAAWEQPELFSAEARAAFRTLRQLI
jgi:hypothetical protein